METVAYSNSPPTFSHHPYTSLLTVFVAQMLKKITTEEAVGDRSTSELDTLKHRDWVRGNELGTRCDTEDNTAVYLTVEDSVVVLKHARVAVVVLCPRHVCGCN